MDTYDIGRVDALPYDVADDGKPIWTWNNSYHIATMRTRARDAVSLKAAFLRKLRELLPGLAIRGRYRIDYDGDVLVFVDIRDNQPIFAAIPQYN